MSKPRSVAVLLALVAVPLAGLMLLKLRGPGSTGEPSSRAGRGPVIFVGLDGADWQLLDGYLAAGAMPSLATLVREGRAGVLTTIRPPLSPLVWTTMMTGAGPLEHGVLDFSRFDPVSGRREPISSGERRVPAIWNMASSRGLRVAVLGMWATYPAEPVNGLVVSDRLFSFQSREASPSWGVVHPPGREAWARAALGAAERAVDYGAVRAYLPWLAEAEYRDLVARPDAYGHPVSALRRILVETRVYHELATETLRGERPDLTIVYIQGTDTIGHVFAPFAPPRQEGISAEEFARYAAVPERYFRDVGRLLGEYLEIARESGATLLLASDHGFFWTEGRPKEAASAAPTAGRWHRDEGIFVLWGPGIEPGSGRSEHGSVAQVCATLLALLGLPPGKDVLGPPLPGAPPAGAEPVDYRATVPAPAMPRATGAAGDDEAIAKLKALGYIGADEPRAVPGGAGRGPEATRTAASYNNEGLILREKGRPAEARAAFERALDLDPRHASTLWNLSDLLSEGPGDLDRGDDLLVRALEAGFPDGVRAVVSRAAARRRQGDLERSLHLLDRAIALRPEDPQLRLHRGRCRLEKEDCRGALADFEVAARQAPGNPLVWASSGSARLCLDDLPGGARDLQRSFELDPDQPEVVAALARLRK